MLDFNNDIKLQFLNTDLEIEDLDIDVEITMTNERTTNEAIVKIWNLSESTKDIIRKDSTGIRILYRDSSSEDYHIVFEGNKKNRIKTKKLVKKKSTGKKRRHRKSTSTAIKKPPKTQRIMDYELDGADLATIVELGENYATYSNSYFSKTYSNSVSSQTVINDLANSMNAGVMYLDKVVHVPYYNGVKFKNNSRTVLSSVCDRLGVNWTFQNGIIVISRIRPKYSNETPALNFTSNNSESPDFEDNDEVNFNTVLSLGVSIGDWVKLVMHNIQGIFKTIKLVHKISNYSAEIGTEITIKEV